MKNNSTLRKFDLPKLSLSVIFVFAFLFLHFVDAQTKPEFLVTWQAQNYVPDWYQGKILPISGTPVNISFELIDNGEIADLSKITIRWYVNDKLVINENNGLGIKNLKINIPDSNGMQTEIRIVVLDYLESMIDKLVYIPVVGPEAVINAPYADEKIKTGSSIFELSPFFFNINNLSNLSVSWLMNGQKPTTADNPYVFNLNVGSETPSGTKINISASIKNILKEFESASQNLNLVIK